MDAEERRNRMKAEEEKGGISKKKQKANVKKREEQARADELEEAAKAERAAEEERRLKRKRKGKRTIKSASDEVKAKQVPTKAKSAPKEAEAAAEEEVAAMEPRTSKRAAESDVEVETERAPKMAKSAPKKTESATKKAESAPKKAGSAPKKARDAPKEPEPKQQTKRGRKQRVEKDDDAGDEPAENEDEAEAFEQTGPLVNFAGSFIWPIHTNEVGETAASYHNWIVDMLDEIRDDNEQWPRPTALREAYYVLGRGIGQTRSVVSHNGRVSEHRIASGGWEERVKRMGDVHRGPPT